MKIIPRKEISSVVKSIRSKGKKVVFTNGCFDIIHAGHIKLLEECSKLGCVIVGINSDSSIKRIKGDKRPINKLKDRIKVLSAIEYVDYIVVFNEDTPYKLIKSIKPDYLVKGGDYRIEDVVGREFAKKTVIIKLLNGRSTTNIIKRIENALNK
ncbi:MAG: D-glycero-beta-D-manno-heptose 1-phosphate adenylyltransferase [Elusimicrobiales bacterium]|nr:D-glycero-beta-D-manno-heptose 1-phosphate adenylyltransferase [Elusimicrobiales bacterium]